jgi:hypothetical protein
MNAQKPALTIQERAWACALQAYLGHRTSSQTVLAYDVLIFALFTSFGLVNGFFASIPARARPS